MAALLSFEIASKWVASSSTVGSYFGFSICTQQPIPLSFLTANKGVKDEL